MCSRLYVKKGEGLMICTNLISDDEDANGGGRPHDSRRTPAFSTSNTHGQHLLAAGPCNDFTYTVSL